MFRKGENAGETRQREMHLATSSPLKFVQGREFSARETVRGPVQARAPSQEGYVGNGQTKALILFLYLLEIPSLALMECGFLAVSKIRDSASPMVE